MAYIKEFKLVNSLYEGIYIYQQKHLENNKIMQAEKLICLVKNELAESEIIISNHNITNSNIINSIYCDKKDVIKTKINNIVNNSKPYKTIVDNNLTHSIWIINDKAFIDSIREDFAPIKLYVKSGTKSDAKNNIDDFTIMHLTNEQYAKFNFSASPF